MARKLFSEWLGTLLLVAVVVGSGIMAERLAGGNIAIALLSNAIATGAILVVLILIFGHLSGAHFNPAVTLAFRIKGDIDNKTAGFYVLAQIFGGILGTVLAHIMFELPLLEASTNVRNGISQWTGEFVATFGLVATILGCLRAKPEAVPYAVGLFITSGYWFTSSTSFANPAVAIARTMTDTFSGIMPLNAPAFIGAELIGATCAVLIFNWLLNESKPE